MNPRSSLRTFACWLLAVGAILCVLSAIFAVSEWNFFAGGKGVQGNVVRQDAGMDTSSPGWPFHPAHSVAQFTDAAGQTHEVRTSLAADPPLFALGDHPRVTYDPKDPKRAKLPGDSMFMRTIWTGIASNAFFMAGACLLTAASLIERRRAKRASHMPVPQPGFAVR